MNVNPLQPEPAVVKSVKSQTYDTVTFTLSFTNGRQGEYRFRPGQYNMVTLFGVGEAPFSISSETVRQDSFDHTIRVVGNLTTALRRLGPASTVGVRGPYGTGWPVEKAEGKNLLIVAGGMGLAPLRPVITDVLNRRSQFGGLEILYGARTPEDLLFTDEHRSWVSQPDTNFTATVDSVPEDEKWDGHVGVVTSLYRQMQTKPKNSVVMICGPQIMMRFALIGLLRGGFPADQIYLSMERRMKCGIGMCGHCQTGTIHVCKDGPVFQYSEIRGLSVPLL